MKARETKGLNPQQRPVCESCGYRTRERRRGGKNKGFYTLCAACREDRRVERALESVRRAT